MASLGDIQEVENQQYHYKRRQEISQKKAKQKIKDLQKEIDESGFNCPYDRFCEFMHTYNNCWDSVEIGAGSDGMITYTRTDDMQCNIFNEMLLLGFHVREYCIYCTTFESIFEYKYVLVEHINPNSLDKRICNVGIRSRIECSFFVLFKYRQPERGLISHSNMPSMNHFNY